MEPGITADIIYSLVLKLKGDGLSDAEIKKALVDSVMGEQKLLQTLNKEAVLPHKNVPFHLKHWLVFFSLSGILAAYFILLPFLNESVATFSFWIVALSISFILVIRLRRFFS